MIQDLLHLLILICPLVFLAGFMDSIAGGGGLISLPAYLLAGLSAHQALGTNKLAMSLGTLVSTIQYIKAGKVDVGVGISAGGGAFLGAIVGSSLAIHISDQALKVILLVALPLVTAFLFAKKDFGTSEVETEKPDLRRRIFRSIPIGLIIGCYDGLIGPGTGTFLLLAFTACLGFDLLTSSGCAKVANLSSNVASMIVFLVHGDILFAVAGFAALFTMAGNYAGAKLAIKGGTKYVRYTVFVVLALLFAKMIVDLIQ